MSESLEPIREELRAGTVSAQSLVLLFRVAEEAEQRHDLQALEEALGLAKQIVRCAGDALEAEAGRLVTLCEQGLERTEAHLSAAVGSEDIETDECPGCGRPLDASAVRCRACGFLLV